MPGKKKLMDYYLIGDTAGSLLLLFTARQIKKIRDGWRKGHPYLTDYKALDTAIKFSHPLFLFLNLFLQKVIALSRYLMSIDFSQLL